jgi:hypothetical protein
MSLLPLLLQVLVLLLPSLAHSLTQSLRPVRQWRLPRLFPPPATPSLAHSLTPAQSSTATPSLPHSLTPALSLTHISADGCSGLSKVIHSLTHSLTQAPTHSLAHSSTHSLAHSSTHSLTHSLTGGVPHSRLAGQRPGAECTCGGRLLRHGPLWPHSLTHSRTH